MDAIDVLFACDGPVLFTASVLGRERLVTLIHADDAGQEWMISSPAPDMLTGLRENRVPLRDASEAAPLFRATAGYGQEARIEPVDGWPEGMLPDTGLMLTPGPEELAR